LNGGCKFASIVAILQVRIQTGEDLIMCYSVLADLGNDQAALVIDGTLLPVVFRRNGYASIDASDTAEHFAAWAMRLNLDLALPGDRLAELVEQHQKLLAHTIDVYKTLRADGIRVILPDTLEIATRGPEYLDKFAHQARLTAALQGQNGVDQLIARIDEGLED
jgi:hypothetical protein